MEAAWCALQTSWRRWQCQTQGPRNLGSRLTLLFDLSVLKTASAGGLGLPVKLHLCPGQNSTSALLMQAEPCGRVFL